ncbi:unnamed protein product [Phytomonas sp. EM1]|nr:unnamed protein product [Phytomonas sp. EM1]|eukprot:CCW64602.1 unnamed protein product [Phytomonas sp. isolate EM1]
MNNKKRQSNRVPDTDTAKGIKYYPEEELAALIRSLNRDEDHHIFAQDVLLTYPYLAESYTKVCPQRCDLATAAAKALDGNYSYSPSLLELRSDLQLMVNNCVRFNGSESPLAETAESFESFFNQKLDEYIQSKTCGRRMSSLRLQQQWQQPQKQFSASRRGPSSNHQSFTNRDVVSLVNSLVRRDDAGAFVVDVAATYPELRESYNAICPNPMNLRIAKERAQAGYYTRTATGVSDAHSQDTTNAISEAACFGPTIADSLSSLREDVELIVSNCIRFNEQIESWVNLARSFQKFAHQRIDEFVLRHEPGLRGTQTGTERYCPSEGNVAGGDNHLSKDTDSSDAVSEPSSLSMEEHQTQHPLATEENAPKHRGSWGQLAAEGNATMEPIATTSRGLDNNKKKTLKWAEILPQPLLVHTCEGVRPDIKPSPLQPSLHIPDHLRRRIVVDYLLRERIGLRLVGKRVWIPFLRDPPSPGVEAIMGSILNDANDAAIIRPSKDDGENGSADDLLIEDHMSAQAVLNAFVKSVKDFYHKQRSRSDFENVFQYSVEDEAVYTRVLDIVGREFNRLLPFAFLYEIEAAELHAWSAERAVDTILSPLREGKRQRLEIPGSGDNTDPHHYGSTEYEERDESSNSKTLEVGYSDWSPSAYVHYSYLVRFLVHFPQMASLCCANRSDAAKGAITTTPTTLRIQKCLLDVIKQVTKVVEEFLVFIDGYERRLQYTV